MVKHKDFKSMTGPDWSKLNEQIGKNLSECSTPPHVAENAFVDAKLKRMNTCIQQAIKGCVFDKKRLSVNKREISEETRQYTKNAHVNSVR